MTREEKRFDRLTHGLPWRGGRGFSLLEIMIVVSIIGVLAAIAVPNFKKARERAQTKACYHNLRTIAGALEWYCADVNLPFEIKSQADFKPLVEGGFLNAEPKCPNGGTYEALGGANPARCTYHGTINK